MSQADYLHFFNNIIWNLIQLLIMYVLISVVYVQSFYKVFRLRLLNYKVLSIILKKQDYSINNFLDIFKEIRNFLFSIFKYFKLTKNNNQKVIKCFYE